MCPNHCPLNFSEGRRQHVDSHHCFSAGWSHWFGYHYHGDQGRGRSFPNEGQWEEVSGHTHIHAHTYIITLLRHRQTIRPVGPAWAQTPHSLCKYLTLPVHSSPWAHQCPVMLTTTSNAWSGLFEAQYCVEYSKYSGESSRNTTFQYTSNPLTHSAKNRKLHFSKQRFVFHLYCLSFFRG